MDAVDIWHTTQSADLDNADVLSSSVSHIGRDPAFRVPGLCTVYLVAELI